MVYRVRDCRGATQGAVRSGAQHRSEREAPQSPTPTRHNCKKQLCFLQFGLWGERPNKKEIFYTTNLSTSKASLDYKKVYFFV